MGGKDVPATSLEVNLWQVSTKGSDQSKRLPSIDWSLSQPTGNSSFCTKGDHFGRKTDILFRGGGTRNVVL